MRPPTAPSLAPFELPLFPLRLVLFPGGRLPLQIFEPRYLAMVSDCLRDGTPFGIVMLRRGSEVQAPAAPEELAAEDGPDARRSPGLPFATVGCLAAIEDWDRAPDGVLRIACRGGSRFRVLGGRGSVGVEPQDRAAPPRQREDGLWLATVRALPDDPPRALPAEPGARPQTHAEALAEDLGDRPLGPGPGSALAAVLHRLAARGQAPVTPPLRLDDAGWVANRWAELLPLPLTRKQRLMAEADPLARLAEVTTQLRGQGLVG